MKLPALVFISIKHVFLTFSLRARLRTFARNFSNIDFFLKILPLNDDELAISEMYKKWGVTDFVLERT